MSREPQKAQRGAAPAQERTGRLDWGHLRFFLELVRTGSHARAAKRLGVDRNTVARHVAALETALGVSLFERGPQGWSCTAAGHDLSELAGRVEEDVLALARHVDARDQALSGTVRLTTAAHLACHLLAPALPRLRERHPGLILEIAADQRTFDLTRREADLAVRMGRPRDAGLVTRRLSEVAYGIYAGVGSPPAERGAVDFAADEFLGFDESMASVPQERWLVRQAPERRVAFRCNSTAALLSAARHGVGVAVLPRFLGDADPSLRRLRGPEPVPHEIWLLVHGDLRRTPRVKVVIDWVDDLVARARPALTGQA
jgi:DNA-binding transcriptional LysR family regulator